VHNLCHHVLTELHVDAVEDALNYKFCDYGSRVGVEVREGV
jgi:hypothetical protein